MLLKQRDRPNAWVVETSTPCVEPTYIKPRSNMHPVSFVGQFEPRE